MLWWESQAVFWASWRGRREEIVKGKEEEDDDDADVVFEDVVFRLDGSRWGHWFSAQADMAGNATALAAEAWNTGGTVFWNTPKGKGEMFSLMELVGVEMLGPKKRLPLPYWLSAGVHNVVPYFRDADTSTTGITLAEGDLFFAMTKNTDGSESSGGDDDEEGGEEETKGSTTSASQLRKRKRQTIRKAKERQESGKPLRYNDGELIKDVAAADPEYGLFPVAYLEAADDVDDMEPNLDL